MNLPVIFTKITGVLKSTCGTGWLFAKKHAPELMIGTGIVGFGATVYGTVKATNKTNDILDEKERKEDNYASLYADSEKAGDGRYTIVDLNADCKQLSRRTKLAIIRTWFPVVTTGAGSVACILGGYRILNGRYVATAAAYKLLETRFDRYRENAIERYGEDVDYQLANNIKAEQLEAAKAERDENTKLENENRKALKKKKPRTAYQDITSAIFDQNSERWQRYWTPDLVMEFLKRVQRQLNDKLRLSGHLFVNEANDILGLKRTPEGQVLGWKYDKDHPDAYVSIGIDEMSEDEIRRIMSTHRNEDIWVRIVYNHMGLVYELI